jgi:GalNAc-alpha-(1->4)-GalNAc-alpha-(1->3)-diNAcBac-PP-undecaprenol alpha-1,4-N-acetyl-D-galactosaminyltransferase
MSPVRNRTPLERFARKILYPKADGIICMTEQAKEIILRETGAKNIAVIPRPLKQMHGPGSVNRTKTILNVGRLHPDKGQGDLIEAFAKLKHDEWNLVFLGDGPSKKNLMEKCKRLNVVERVSFAGSVSDVDSWYYSSSIFAFTSYNEGFPNALSEAMHASMACVSYDCVSGPKEMINDQVSGLLVPVGDIDSMTQALDRLIENKDFREVLGRNANRDSARFCLENIALRILNFCYPRGVTAQLQRDIF